MLRITQSLLLALCASVVLERAPVAQCSFTDQLDGGPCCTATKPLLPVLPNFTQDVLDICWRDCNVDQTSLCQARWTNVKTLPFTNPGCGERAMKLELFDVNGVLKWQGRMRLLYSRTWLETDSAGFFLQVWRFLLNGDLRPTSTAGALPCPVPPCAPAQGNRVRFTGYIDFALNCSLVPGFYQEAWMLTHACDFVDHKLGFPRAGVFHPDRAYTFVAPAAGFVPGALQPTEGTPGSPFESLRQRRLASPPFSGPTRCDFEEPCFHSLLPQQQLCLCGTPGMPPQYLIGDLSITGACGNGLFTPAGGGPLLPGFVSMGLGSWTLPGTFPGIEVVRWNAGEFIYIDGCFGLALQEVYFGATTLGGFPATQLIGGGPGGPLPATFVDQANSRDPASGALLMNAPFVSSEIHNLNH